MAKPRIGLALGSGAARGWAHIGVLRALEKAGVEFDVVCGTSIGALVGGLWMAGYLDRLEAWSRTLNRIRILRYMDIGLAGGGLIAGARLTQLLQDSLGEMQIDALRPHFVTVATELVTGHEIWLREGTLVDCLRASYALPGVFAPVAIGGRWLVDGALVNPVPVSVCRAYGARLIIAVNLNSDMIGKGRKLGEAEMARPEAEAMLPRTAEKPARRLLGQLFGRSEGPSFFNVMVSSLNILQDRISRSRLAGDPPDVTIAPRLGHIGLLEFDRAEEAISEGEAAVARALPFLREALAVLET